MNLCINVTAVFISLWFISRWEPLSHIQTVSLLVATYLNHHSVCCSCGNGDIDHMNISVIVY